MKKNINKKVWNTVLFIALLGCIAGAAFLCWNLYMQYTAGREYEDGKITLPATTSQSSKPTGNTPSSTQAPTTQTQNTSGVDFKKWQNINSDCYAWIRIPNTHIDYPVVQSTDTDDSFYLSHNIYKEYEFAGCIYTEKANLKSFDDPNTIIYGHNMLNGTMFRDLNNFREKDFFDSNKCIYIYTPTKTYQYEIFAAYEYDDRHILNAFNFKDKAVYQEYLNYATNPTHSKEVFTRNIPVTTDDKIITLSTCYGNIETSRYLVQGVLING